MSLRGRVSHCWLPIGDWIDILDQKVLCNGTVLCIVWCSGMPWASTHWMPIIQFPSPVVTTPSVSRHCQESSKGHNGIFLRNKLCGLIDVKINQDLWLGDLGKGWSSLTASHDCALDMCTCVFWDLHELDWSSRSKGRHWCLLIV